MTPAPTARRAEWAVINIAASLYALVPVVWVLSLALKHPSTFMDGHFFPRRYTFQNFVDVFRLGGFGRPLLNSIGIACLATAIAVVIGAFAAYAIARLEFPGKRLIAGGSLLIAMFPQVSLVTPLFEIERSTGLFNTWPGLILPYVAFALPLTIYTLSAFLKEIPWELERAAMMDGAKPFQAFRSVILPLAMPGVATASILAFILCWNDFVFAISLTSSNASRTAPAAIAFFTGASQFENPVGSVCAAAVIITIPIVVFVLIFQRRIIRGLTSGAVKG